MSLNWWWVRHQLAHQMIPAIIRAEPQACWDFCAAFPLLPLSSRGEQKTLPVSTALWHFFQFAYRINLYSKHVFTVGKAETGKAEKSALRKSWERKTTVTQSSKQQVVVTNLLLKADLKIQIFIKFTFSHHTSKKFLHYSWLLKIGLMWSWCELSLPSFPCYSFLCHATVQGHPYTHRCFPANYHVICCCQELPNYKGIFLPHFRISFWFWFGVVFHLFEFLMALQTHRKIKTNCRANLELIDPMEWIYECLLMMIYVTWLEIWLLISQRCYFSMD